MRAERLLRIVVLLQARGRATAGALARELEVSPRTIQRDMDALSGAGIPVYSARGGGGGWALLDDYRTNLAGITTADALAITVGQPRGLLADLGLDDPGDGAVLKLLSVIAPVARQQAEHARQRIHVEFGPWAPAADRDPRLPLLQRAVWSDRVIQIRYGSAPASVPVAPLGLVRHGTTWYLVARREDEFRTYRVSRLQDIVLSDESFERPPDFDLAAHWREAAESFAETFPVFVVSLRLRGAALKRARWVYARSKTISEPDADRWADAELDFGDEENALTAVRTLGNDVIVRAPESLRQAAVDTARAFLDVNT
ncbi:MAG: helix-turn-helix transcriptional regulator [Actinopolymorphaceae bacterium]